MARQEDKEYSILLRSLKLICYDFNANDEWVNQFVDPFQAVF